MSGAAKVNFQVTNLTQVVNPTTTGIHFIQGRSLRGKFNSPDEVINSWPQFVSKYGGLSEGLEAPKYIKRLLEKGSSIRFNRIGHYTDITDSTTLDALKALPKENVYIEITGMFTTGQGIQITIDGDALDSVPYTTSHKNTIDLAVAELMSDPKVQEVIVVRYATISDPRTLLQITPSTTFTTFLFETTGTTPPTVVQEISGYVVDSLNINTNLFRLLPKENGADANNIIVTITPGLNGQAGYFNINVTHATDYTVNESYPNLQITGDLLTNPNYLDKVKAESNYIEPEYATGITLDHAPIVLTTITRFQGGTDGTVPVATDYIGDSAGANGFFAFDDYDDSMELTSFDVPTDDYLTVALAGTAYASNRKDLINYVNLDAKDKTTLIQQREFLGDSKYQYIVGGGLKLLDPNSNAQFEANVLADVLSSVARNDRDFGPWYSFAGPNRGIVTGALGVVVNYGAPAKSKDLDELANRQINMMVNKAGSIKLWGSFTGQYSNDQERFINVERLIIYLQKSLRPTLDAFLEEPNDIPTWRRIYYTVKPFLDNLATKRAFYYYDWQGDQFVNSIDNLQVNNATDVGQGKYKVNLLIKPIPPIQEINVNIILAPTGVSFEIANELI